MIKIAVQNEYRAPLSRLLRQPEIMHHDLVIARLDVTLMVSNVRVFHPEIKTVKAAVGYHFLTEFPGGGRVEWFQSVQERVSVPVRYFYGICFPVHVELNACHE